MWSQQQYCHPSSRRSTGYESLWPAISTSCSSPEVHAFFWPSRLADLLRLSPVYDLMSPDFTAVHRFYEFTLPFCPEINVYLYINIKIKFHYISGQGGMFPIFFVVLRFHNIGHPWYLPYLSRVRHLHTASVHRVSRRVLHEARHSDSHHRCRPFQRSPSSPSAPSTLTELGVIRCDDRLA